MNKFISARAVLSHLLCTRPSFVKESREGLGPRLPSRVRVVGVAPPD